MQEKIVKTKKAEKDAKPGQPVVRRPLPKYTVGHKLDDEWLWRLISMYRTVKATNGGLLTKDEYVNMCDMAITIFKSEGVLHNIKVPDNGYCTVIGDLHGAFDDFVIFYKMLLKQ